MADSDNILEDISRSLSNLRKSDRRVADFILHQPSEIPNMTLAELAKQAGVSEPTVMRFCNAIGCSGFQNFKLKLVASLALGLSTTHAAIDHRDDVDTLIKKIFAFNLSSLAWARNSIISDQIEAAINILHQSHHIDFYGFGASAIVASDAQQKFPLFGVPCNAPTDAHQMLISASMLSEKDTAVAISNTGITKEIIQIIDVAKQNGAKTIAITGSQSPLLAHVDAGIVIDTLENTDVYTPTISRVAALVVVDLLSTAVSLKKGNKHNDRVIAMKQRLSRYRMTGDT